MLHKSQSIEAAASALGNQLAAGIPLREATGRMARLQPEHAELWREISEILSRGGRLSTELTDVWPDGIVAAIRAGEESGTLQDVFKRIAKSLEVAAQVKKIFSKLMSPLAAFGAGFGVFLFFMIGVIPKLQAGLGGSEQSLVFKVSTWMHDTVMSGWPFILGGLVVSGYLAYQWVKSPGSMDTLIELGNRQPKLGGALRSLFFGMWAYQLAMLDAAGLPMKQQLLLSVKTLPECYRLGVTNMADEVEKRGIADSADSEKQIDEDPRREWPFYIVTAFITAHETGRLDEEMQRCAPILVEEGLKQITAVLAVADLFAKLCASVMIGLPLMAYFSQMANSLTKAFS
jgi:type IV pilus assembly protein PilC